MRVTTAVMSSMRDGKYRLFAACALSILFAALTAAAASATEYKAEEGVCKTKATEICVFSSAWDVEQQQVKLEKGYNAYLCLGDLDKNGNIRGSACTGKEVEHGTTFAWNPGKTWSAYWPVKPFGSQEGSHGTEAELWVWAWGPV